MATVIESRKNELDIDSISEYVREKEYIPEQIVSKSPAKLYGKELLESASEVISVARAIKSAVLPAQTSCQNELRIADISDTAKNLKPDVLETLWPGVHQDFSHSVNVKRTPSYYMTLGFMGGAVLALVIAWSFSGISSLVANCSKTPSALTQAKSVDSVTSSEALNQGVRIPLISTYEVKEGDTLAAIALQNYKHVSPRLLEEICRVNNLTDANVLNLGQKLTLPEYHY